MKICFIHTLYAPHIVGGAEISVRLLVESLRDSGHEVVVLATDGGKGLHEETVNGIKVYRAGIENNYWLYGERPHSKIRKVIWHMRDIYNQAMRRYVREVLRKEKPDVVSCHNPAGWSISVWDAIREAGVPTVQVLHDYYFLCLKSTLFKDGHSCKGRCVTCKMARLLHRYKSRQVNAVVGVSSQVLNRVTAAGFFQKSLQAVVYNARYIPDVLPKRKEKQNNLVFGFIGTLSQSKGIEWLLSEFKKIDSLTISLKIAGKGDSSYENSLKDIAEDDKRICFLGVCKPEVFYPAIDVLVVPSIWEEPLGMVAIEACAYHVPVITSGQGGLKEIIKDGYNGLYCDVDDPSTLYTTMIKIIDDCELLNKLCKNARASIRFFLDTDRLISGYEEIYRKLIVKQDDFPCKKQ